MALSSNDIPLPGLVMVVRDHGAPDSTAAFFNESMRRDAMGGARIVHALWDMDLCQIPGWHQGEKKLTSRARAECSPENTQHDEHNTVNCPLAHCVSPTGATNKKTRNKNWLANMSMKYTVASRRIESKRLGMLGCLVFVPNFLAVATIIKNARMSVIPQRGECEA